MTADIVAKVKMEFRKQGEERRLKEMTLAHLLYHALVDMTSRDTGDVAVGLSA